MFLSLSMPVLLYKVLVHTRGYIFFKLPMVEDYEKTLKG